MLVQVVNFLLSHSMLTGQFADKLTRGQSNRRLVNLWTGQLADSKFFLNRRKTILYLYTKPNTTPNHIDY